MGDSAGALISLWGYSSAPVKLRKAIKATCVFYGVFGIPPTDTPAHVAFESDGLGPRSVRSSYAHVDPSGMMGKVGGLTPMAVDFSLPPNLEIIGAGEDPLLEHSIWLHERPGCKARLTVVEGLAHGFLSAENIDPRAIATLSDLSRRIF